MAKEIIVDIKINGTDEAVSNVQKLEQEIEKLNKQKEELLKSPSVSSGDFSKKIDEIDSQLSKLGKTYESATGKAAKFEKAQKNLEGVAKTISGSVGIATAALATFGVKNEEVEKTLLKVQAAASFSQGLKDLSEGVKGLGGAFGTLTKIMLANPFVLIGTLVAGLVTYFVGVEEVLKVLTGDFSSLFKLLGNGSDDVQQINADFEALVETQKEYVTTLENANRESERNIKLLTAQGAGAAQIAVEQLKIIDNNIKINELNKDFNRNLSELFKGISIAKDLQTTAQNNYNEAVQKEADLQTDAAVVQINTAKEIADKQKEAADKVKAANEKRIADEKKAADELKKENEKAQADALITLQNNLNAEVEAVKKTQQDKVNLLNQEFLDGKMSYETLQAEKILLEKEANEAIIKVRDDFRLTDVEKLKIGLDNYKKLTDANQKEITAVTKANADIDINLKKGVNDFEKKTAEELADFESKLRADKLAAELKQEEDRKKRGEITAAEEVATAKALAEAKYSLTKTSLDAISTVSDIFFLERTKKAKGNAKEEEKLAKQQFAVNKALALSSAIVDGFKAVTATIAVNPPVIAGIPNPTFPYALAATLISSAIPVAKIAASKFESKGTGSSSAPSANIPSLNTSGSIAPTNFQPTAFGTGANQQQTFGGQGGNGGGNVLRAYVSETDLTTTSRRLGLIRSASEL